MPGYIQELRDSRTFDVNVTGGSAQFRYVLTGETDEEAAYDLVLATSPGTWFDYTRDKIDMTNRPALGTWFPVVNYTLPVFEPGAPLPTGGVGVDSAPESSPSSAPPPAGQKLSGVSCSIGLESQHIVRSRETISRTAPAGQTAKDYKGLINVSEGKDGKVEGTDTWVPVAKIGLKRTLPTLTAGYFRNLLRLCGKTNASKWWLFDFEEGLFAGMSGQYKGSGEFECDFEFWFQETKTNIIINDEITVPEKKGWHYLWVSYAEKQPGANQPLVQRPLAAYVERVIETAEFTWLGV
jgi:hypothetical protein